MGFKMSVVGKFGISVVALSAALLGTAIAQEKAGSISKWGASPTWKGDGWEFKISGRVNIDYASVEADEADADWNASELRRFRLGASGSIGSNIKYKMEMNTNSSGEVNAEDAYIQWAPTSGDWNIRLGQQRTPNSLDESTSSRYTSLLERAAFTDAFQFNRRLGVTVNKSGENYTLAAGVFGDNLEVSDQEEGTAIAARGTFNPIKSDTTLVHLGASFRIREIGDTQSDLRYRQRPVSHIPGRIISTGSIADSDTFIGAEAAALVNNFWVAGEYGQTSADCTICSSDPDFDGGYAEAGVFIGGKKVYKGGKFNRPKVDTPVTDGGNGAVSLVARFDTINLNDGDIDGGEYDSFSLGADWWPTRYTRLGVNYFNVDANLGTSTSGLDSNFAALVTAFEPSESVSGVILRAQFDF